MFPSNESFVSYGQSSRMDQEFPGGFNSVLIMELPSLSAEKADIAISRYVHLKHIRRFDSVKFVSFLANIGQWMHPGTLIAIVSSVGQ